MRGANRSDVYEKPTNAPMKCGNRNLAARIARKAGMPIRMRLEPSELARAPAGPPAGGPKGGEALGREGLPRPPNSFIPFLHQAVRQVKPLVELERRGGANARFRRRKPKAVPMASRRGEGLAVG